MKRAQDERSPLPSYQLESVAPIANETGQSDDTALHRAVRDGHLQAAAALLAAGADWRVANAEGKRALDLSFTTLQSLHRIRQEYQRLPVAPYDGTVRPTSEIEARVRQLDRDGFLKIGGLIDPALLAQLQRDFDRFANRLKFTRWLPRKRFYHYDQEEYWHPHHRDYVTNDALACSPALLSICCDPRMTETANHYLRKPSHIKRTTGMRYLPSNALDISQFAWHHDMEDRQLKLMILLTDVDDEDQYMTFVRGSHSALHPYPRFLKNALDADYCRTYLDDIEIVKTTGRAGDVFLFDSNGMHRGNRSPGRLRDALFIEFTADRNKANLWGTAIPRNRLPPDISESEHPLKKLVDATPKWVRTRTETPRTRPSWAESLEDPTRWL